MNPRALVVTALVLLATFGAQPVNAVASTTTPASSTGGVALDGFGGLHVFGGANVDTSGQAYWRGWDIARSLALLPDGSGGWVLDAWGGIHPFGAAAAPTSRPYWPRWDIARALVMNPDGQSGYELDAWGGIHPVGGARALTGGPYWPGWDIARGLGVHYDLLGQPDGGWVLDAWGGLHAFGAAPSLPAQHFYPGFDYWRGLHVANNGSVAYMVGRWGWMESATGTPAVNWSGYPSWGGWDIVRDVALLGTTGAWTAPPVDRAAAGALVSTLNNMDRQRRGLPALSIDSRVLSIAGAGAGYDLSSCGGRGSIADRSADMFNRNYFAHAIPGCSSTDYVWQTYYRATGISFSTAGENIGWLSVGDLSDAAWQINISWLNSPEHLANITARDFRAIGCGGYSGAGYQGYSGPVWIWTCDFRG